MHVEAERCDGGEMSESELDVPTPLFVPLRHSLCFDGGVSSASPIPVSHLFVFFFAFDLFIP